MLAVVSAMSLASLMAQGQCLPYHSLDEGALCSQDGENIKIVFHYKWGPINADVARGYLSTDETKVDGQRCLKTRIYGKTAKFYDNFFKVREEFVTWFKLSDLRAVRHERDTQESKYFCTNEYSFDYDSSDPHITAVIETSKKPLRTEEIPLTDCLYDLPRVFFMLRNLDRAKLKEGEVYPISFAIDAKVKTFQFSYMGLEECKIRGVGNIRALKFGVSASEDRVFSGEDMYIWFSDDGNMIPIRFKAPVKVGLVEGRIESYKGLKHPFDSLLEKD